LLVLFLSLLWLSAPFLLLSVLDGLLFLFCLPLRLSMLSTLLCGFGLLMFSRSFLGMIFLFVLLLVLGG